MQPVLIISLYWNSGPTFYLPAEAFYQVLVSWPLLLNVSEQRHFQVSHHTWSTVRYVCLLLTCFYLTPQSYFSRLYPFSPYFAIQLTFFIPGLPEHCLNYQSPLASSATLQSHFALFWFILQRKQRDLLKRETIPHNTWVVRTWQSHVPCYQFWGQTLRNY